jgi:PAS domain S-box-containing protein
MSATDGGSTLAAALSASRADEPAYFIQRALLAAIVDSSDDAIVSKTLDGRILSWNASATRIFGYTAEEAIGRSITIIVPPELFDEERQILEKLRQGRRIDHFDTVRVTKDGRRIPISLTVSPIRDAHGTVVGASKIARDIAERTYAEEALRASELALREADRRKDEFLALLAHELRNPLAPIRYALAIAGKADCSAEQQRRAEDVIARQIAHMGRLLDDLLDTSRITRGTLELKKNPTELTSIIGAAIETSRPALIAKNQQLLLDLPRQAVWLDADALRLAQVFSNLLINASKYTDPAGQIRLHAREENHEVIVSVRDNGIGIAPEMIPRLFTLFCQAHGALDRSEGGLGIGLSLARGLVELHGGSITAHSDGVSTGSEFTVRLPAGSPVRETSDAQTPAQAANDSGLKILVVDDNRDGADSLATLLQLAGHRVRTAYGGKQALELLATFKPVVLLADIGLPDFSGYELARRIRTESRGVDLTLVAVTGWGQQSDRLRALEAGFDHHLTKPIAPEQLMTLLQGLAEGASACRQEDGARTLAVAHR